MNAEKQQPIQLKKKFCPVCPHLGQGLLRSYLSSWPPGTVTGHQKATLYFIAKTESISKKNSQTLLHAARFEGLGEKGNESLYQFSRSREIPGPSPGQMHSGGCSCQPQTEQRRPPGSPSPSCCAWGNVAPAAPGSPSRS